MFKQVLETYFDDNYLNLKYYLRSRFNQLNEYDAEDIIQQTVMRLLYKGEDLMAITNLPSYVYTSLQNGAKDYFKKNNRIVLKGEDIDDRTVTTEEEVLSNELMQDIKEAIDALDDKSKYIFVETEIKGRSYESIMAETGEKLGTLLSRKNRAKKKLQQMLKQHDRR